MPRKKQDQGPETNEQFLARVMEFAKCGPLMQLFIIEGVRKYAEACAQADAKKMDSGFISGAQWKRCAMELHEEISRHLGE